MDLISAHRQGLADQLAEEARGLAGRPQDHVQRAIVAHHLFDHSGGSHTYALFVAEGALAFDGAVERMKRQVRRARWHTGARKAEALLARVERFAATLAAIEVSRCEAMWMAYRAAQNGATGGIVPAALTSLFEGDVRAMFRSHQAWFEAEWGIAVEGAIAELAWPLSASPVRALLASLRIDSARLDQAERRGLRAAERTIIGDKRLPDKFAANPAHHYYALQRAMASKRRQERCRIEDFPVEETVRLAAAA